jgi:hypothetical protein
MKNDKQRITYFNYVCFMLTVDTPLVHRPALATGDVDKIIEVIPKGIHHSVYRKKPIKTQIS